MRMIYQGFAAALIVATGIVADGAKGATSESIAAFEGRWNGRVNLDCVAVSASMEIVIEDGDMSGQATIRGAGEGSGTYKISGYVDSKGRISDGQMQGPFGLSMRGNLTSGEGKGQFFWSGVQRQLESLLARSGTAAGARNRRTRGKGKT